MTFKVGDKVQYYRNLVEPYEVLKIQTAGDKYAKSVDTQRYEVMNLVTGEVITGASGFLMKEWQDHEC